MLISISSSDLDSGRRPIAISDEFSEISILVSEIRRCENKAFPKKRPTYWDFESMVGGAGSALRCLPPKPENANVLGGVHLILVTMLPC